MAINVPLNAQLQNPTQLQQQIQNAVNSVRINLGGQNGARALSSLSQPLGRLTGQADEFTKSLDAANARVLAFGASVGVVNAVTSAFKSLVNSTIEVEKAITAISVVGDQFTGKTKELGQGLFKIAKETGQSFSEVSKAALEFSRQGLLLEDTLSRTQDALILTRLTGLDAAKSVDGLTAAFNAFSKAGLSTTQIVNKLAAVDQAFAVSSADLIEGFNRSAAVAQNAGVTFDELAGIITALQQETSRGGAVIGNALKTIFTRLQDTSTLNNLQNLGVAVQDLQGNILPARQILQNLATDVEGLSQITKAGIFKDVAGTFQINQLISLVGDLNKENSIAAKATLESAGATNEAYVANEKLNQSLDAILNKVANTGKQLGSILGELGLTDNLKGLLDGINSFLEGASSLLQGDDLGSNFAKGFVKGIGAVLSGPGLGIFLAIIGKLSFDLAKFGAQSLKAFFGIGKAAADQKLVQESIVQTLLKNQSVLSTILNTQGGQNAQALKFLGLLNQQATAMQAIQGLAGGIASTVYSGGFRATAGGLQRKAAGGYLPAQEASDVSRGVGGASPSSKVVSIPNFAFGGGKRGTMIANTSEYIVPNYAGGGSAIFNQDMVKTMGLPAGAKKISAAGGFVPNFRLKNQTAIQEGKIFEKKLNKKFFGKESYSPNAPLDFPLPIGFGTDQQARVELGISPLSQYGDAKRSFNRSNSVSLLDKYLRTSEGKLDFLKSRTDEKGFIKLNPKGLSMLFLYGEENPSNTIYAGTKNKSFSVATQNLIESKLSRTKNPNLSRTIKMPLITDKVNQDALNSSNGYIPNFANYVFDSDRLPSGSRDAILNAILSSPKRKNLLAAPAGAGKSTYASNLGAFISSLDDVKKASSFTILSGASLSSKGGLSSRLTDILAAVNASGGTSSYLGVSNKDIFARRSSREITDTRSAQQLAGTAFTPLNQTSLIKQLKSSSSNFEMIREAKTNQDLAVLGLYGKNGTINGSPVYTLQSQRPELFKDIKKNLQKNVTNLVQGYSSRIGKSIGIPVVPKNIEKSLGQLPSVAGFMFEDVLNQLAGPDFDSNRISGGARADFPLNANLRKIFGATGSQKYAEIKLNPYTSDAVNSIKGKQKALAAGVLGPQAIAGDRLSDFKSRAISLGIGQAGRVDTKMQFKRNAFTKELIDSGIIKSGYGTSADQTKAIKRALGIASGGYIPNFAAAALQQAIAREKSAGLSDSQIYVDQDSALKSSMNPMGLMVANRRDEPAGGFQGIARARKEGVNPKLYGAAGGFVPNLAAPTGTSPNIDKVEKGFGDLAGKFIILQSALSFFEGGFTEAGSVAEKFSSGLQTAVSAVFAYQAVMQLRAKQDKAELLKSGKLFGVDRSRVARYGIGQQLGGTARGGLLGTTQRGYGLAAGRLSTATLGGAAGAVGVAGIVLKSFNDIASLFYTKSPKVAQSLELLSAAAMEASQSLNTVDKSEITGGLTALKSQSTGALLTSFINTINPLRLGREQVSYTQQQSGTNKTNTTLALLKGGQSKEDFSKIQSDLMALFYSDLKVSIKDAPTSDLKMMAQNSVINAFDAATTTGISGQKELDLEKVLEDNGVQRLIAKSKDTAKKLEITASNVEFEKPVRQFKLEIEKIISDGALAVENATKQLERQSKLISAISSSKTFSSLSDSSKIAFEINSASTQLTKELENRVSKFANDAQSSLEKFIPELGVSLETKESLTSSVKSLGGAKTQEDLNKNLDIFSDTIKKAGGSVDNAKFAELQKAINNLKPGFGNLGKEIEVEKAILAFNNSEKLLEARAYDTYKSKLAGFVEEMIKGQTSLIQMRGDLDRIDIKKQGDIETATANARSSREAMLLRQDIESKAFQKKQPTEQKILLQEKELAAKREFFTKDNIAGLNRNTEALNNLTRLFASDFINKIDAAILGLQDAISKGSNDQSRTFDTVEGMQLPQPMTAPEALKYFQELKGVYSPSASLPMASSGGNLRTAGSYLETIGNSVRGGSTFEQIQDGIGKFDVTPEMQDRFTEYAQQLLLAYKESSEVFADKLQTLKDQQKTEKDIFDLQNSYAIKLQAQIRSLEDSLTDPQSMGEYASKQRQIARNDRENALGSEEDKRAYRSSLGYGLSQGFEELEKRTLDYKQELGVVIPNLFSSNLAQGLNDAISGAKDLKTALTDAATAFFQEITRKNISNLADMVTGGIGGFFTNKASGGLISGGSGTKDDVPAMLMGGEYVVKKSAVNKYGKGFLDALNNGKMRGYATGGMVDPQTFPTQTGRGGFFTPGDYGQGAITGKNELLTFASQSFTGGQYDYMGGFGMGGASVGLEPESARLSAFGRENSPMFERVQQSKDEAFKVYLEGLQKEKEYAELLDQIAKDKKARKKALQTAIISAVASAALNYAGSVGMTGAKNATAASLASGGKGGFLTSLKGGVSNLGNIFNPSKALGLSQDAKFFQSIGVGSSKDLFSGKVSSEDYGKLFEKYPNLGKSYTGAYRASGGLISGGSNIRDDVPTMLTGGEFVLNNRATQRIGVQNLNQLNNGQSVGGEGASAEMTQALVSKLDELIQATQNSSSENVVVNVSSNESDGQNQQNPMGAEKELHKKIRQAVLDVIAQEKRLGGSLEKSR